MSSTVTDRKDVMQDLIFATENIENSNNWKEFSERVASFLKVESHWRLKPFSLSPPACAQFGWKCIGKDLIQCAACNEIICGKLPVLWSSNVYDECVDAITKSLQTSHKKYCPWPLAPCPDYFVRIEPIDKKQAYHEFVNRLETLLQIKEDLPQIKNETLKTEITENDLNSLSQSCHKELDNFTRSAIILALMGWSKSLEKKNCLWCCHCQRLLELRFYKTVKLCENDSLDKTTDNADSSKLSEDKLLKVDDIANSSNLPEDKLLNSVKSDELENVEDAGSSSNIKAETKDNLPKSTEDFKVLCDKKDDEELSGKDEPPKKIPKMELKSISHYFDPVYEHRYWCMWISSITINASKSSCNTGKRGWQIYLKSLLLNVQSPAVSSKCVVSPEKIKTIRHMLENWT